MNEPTLDSLREEIGRINQKILELLNQRMGIALQIKGIKLQTDIPFFDPAREMHMLADLVQANHGPLSDKMVQKIFHEIFSISLTCMEEERKKNLHVQKKTGQEQHVVTVREKHIGKEPILIAGPCSVESREQIFTTAAFLKNQCGVHFLRGGGFKPRTSPYSFQGLGIEGLRLLREAADYHDMVVVTEITDARQLDKALGLIDIVQVGARNMYNYDLLKSLGETKKPIVLKRGFSATIEELIMASEYLATHGNTDIILCERGIRTFEPATRFTLDISGVALLKQEVSLPVLVDVSHGTGRKDIMVPMAKAALAAGADGIMLEVHPQPAIALSDNQQQMDFAEARRFVDAVFPGLISKTTESK